MNKIIGILGRKYLLLIIIGLFGVAILALGAVPALRWLAPLGSSIALGAVLSLTAWNQVEIRRQKRSTDHSGPRSEPAVPSATKQMYSHEVMSVYIDHAVDRAETAMRDNVRENSQAVAQQLAALLNLRDAYPTLPVASLSAMSLTPQQVDGVLGVIGPLRPRRVLCLDLGASVPWVWRAVTEGEGEVWAIDAPTGLDQNLFSLSAGSGEGIHRVSVPTAVPRAPHAYLPWHDLDQLTETFDMVILGITSQTSARAAVAVLPVISPHLTSDGHVVVAQQSSTMNVAQAWSASVDWEETASGADVAVFRRSA